MLLGMDAGVHAHRVNNKIRLNFFMLIIVDTNAGFPKYSFQSRLKYEKMVLNSLGAAKC
jgi:hypothetical protein